jgi:hypothetical protein
VVRDSALRYGAGCDGHWCRETMALQGFLGHPGPRWTASEGLRIGATRR